MLQHSRQSLTPRSQRQLWQQRRRAHRARRTIRQQEYQQRQSQEQPTRLRHRSQPAAQLRQSRPLSSSLQQQSVQRSTLKPAVERVDRSSSRVRSKGWSGFFYLTRMMIVGSGVAAIAGTILSIVDLKSNPPQARSQPAFSAALTPFSPASTGPGQPPVPKTFEPQADPPKSLFYRWSQEPRLTRLIRKGQELSQAKQTIRQWSAAQSGLTPAMFFLNPETGHYLNIGGEQSIPAASTIKIPVLMALFEDVDAGKIDLDEPLVMRQDLVATEAGSMQYQPVGTQFSALETAEHMIEISDNTATNMLIDRLGGLEKLNQRFKSWGLKHTKIRNPLPDLEGTNTISPQEMASLMLELQDGDLLSAASQKQALAILQQTVTDTLLPRGLDKDAKIAHKTGDIGSVVGDIGLVEMPNGQHYVAAILVQRPHNDPRAQDLIRKISKLTYQTFKNTDKPPSAAATERN